MRLTLKRETLSPATLGTLSIDGVKECDTLELPWRDNKPGISCIPAGRYRVTWTPSLNFERHTLRLQDVPGRSGILIHSANFQGQLRGCIAPGMRRGESVIDSRAAVLKLEAKVVPAIERGEAVTIEIINPEAGA